MNHCILAYLNRLRICFIKWHGVARGYEEEAMSPHPRRNRCHGFGGLILILLEMLYI